MTTKSKNRGMTEKRKQRHRPYAGDDRPGKPSRIAFWDNIFYWLWHYVARNGGYAFRAGGIIALIQFIYCLLAIAITINCLNAEAAWTLYLHEKGKGIAGGLVILLLPALMIVHSYIYKESRYEKLKSRFGQMEDGERARYRMVFRVFLAVTAVAGYAAYKLFCRFGGQFLLPG